MTELPVVVERKCSAHVKCLDSDITRFVFVKAQDAQYVLRLRGFDVPNSENIPATIWEAISATFTCTPFFQNITIRTQIFGVDPGITVHTTVNEVCTEAIGIWSSQEFSRTLEPLVDCSISIGPGMPEMRAPWEYPLTVYKFPVWYISKYNDRSARQFAEKWTRYHYREQSYVFLNVDRGLEGIGFGE
jgi:hypothetical protein